MPAGIDCFCRLSWSHVLFVDNPCPAQGPIVNIRLSEIPETVQMQDGNIREIVTETFFQMNYHTGDWRRIKKAKQPLP